jgi:hypothetical protein
MDHRTALAELHRPLSAELLASSIPARLAYTGRDGAPRVVPVAFDWTGREIVVCTVVTSAKVPALRRDPRVALTIDAAGLPPRALLVRGTASVAVVDGVPDEYVRASAKLVPAEAFAGWEAGVRALYAQMACITVTPRWAKLLDFETTLPEAVAELVAAR